MFIVLTFFWCLSNSADTFHITEKKRQRELMISPNGEQIAIQKKKKNWKEI